MDNDSKPSSSDRVRKYRRQKRDREAICDLVTYFRSVADTMPEDKGKKTDLRIFIKPDWIPAQKVYLSRACVNRIILALKSRQRPVARGRIASIDDQEPRQGPDRQHR